MPKYNPLPSYMPTPVNNPIPQYNPLSYFEGQVIQISFEQSGTTQNKEEGSKIDMKIGEDDMLTDTFKSGFDDSMEEIFKTITGVVSILPSEYGEVQELEYTKEDCFDAFLSRECLFLDDEFSNHVLFERPNEVMRSHMHPLHIKAMVKGRLVSKVLIDGGVAISLLPETMIVKLGKGEKDLITTNVLVTDFSKRTLRVRGILMLSVKVGSVERPTTFLVVPSRVSYNVLLGRD